MNIHDRTYRECTFNRVSEKGRAWGEGGVGGVRMNPTWDVNIEVIENKLPWENSEDCQTVNLLFWKSPPKDAGVVKLSL